MNAELQAALEVVINNAMIIRDLVKSMEMGSTLSTRQIKHCKCDIDMAKEYLHESWNLLHGMEGQR